MDKFVVPASPTPAQIAAGLRQAITVIGTALSAVGFSGAAGHLNDAVAYVGLASAIIAIVWGQLATRKQAQKLAITADAAPDKVAEVAK